MTTELKFHFTPQEIDYIANVLSDRPYKEVRGLLDKIVSQANDKDLQSPPAQPELPGLTD